GFVQGEGRYDMETGRFAVADEPKVDVSHLSAVFGLVEINAELLQQVDMPAFEEAWLTYCRLYNAPEEEVVEELGEGFGDLILRQGHTRLDAYAAVRLGEPRYAERAWRIFLDPPKPWEPAPDWDYDTERVTHTLNPTDWR